MAVHLRRQSLDPLCEGLHRFGELSVLLQHLYQHRRLIQHERLARFAELMQVLAMLRIRLGVQLVALGLAGLRQQNQRCRVGGLQTEGEVQQDERIFVKRRQPHDVDDDPERHHKGLTDEKHRRAEEAGEGFRLQREPVVAKHRREMGMRQMEAKEFVA